MSLDDTFMRYNIDTTGILHIGTHKSEEITIYQKYIGKNKIVFANSDILENRLGNAISEYNIPFNFINLNVQGVELTVLKCMEYYLTNINYIYMNINKKNILLNELDTYLNNFDFYRIETLWPSAENGSTFYIRKNISGRGKYVIFNPAGRLGNAIFRYMACAIFCTKYGSTFVLQEDCPKIDEYTFYKNLDLMGNDVTYISQRNITDLKTYCKSNPSIEGFNTLGFVKNNISLNNLESNAYINNNNDHGIFVKNIVEINDKNYIDSLQKDLYGKHLFMNGYFQFDIYLKYKNEILEFMKKNKNEHYVTTYPYRKFLMKDIVDDMILDNTKIYDIVIHIRLGDANGCIEFIEFEYYEKLFETINFNNSKTAIVIESPKDKRDRDYLDVSVEINDMLIDFNIMKHTKILICSMSTFAWMAAFLSKHITTCYMPNYDFTNNRPYQNFKTPIENTIFYNVVTKGRTC